MRELYSVLSGFCYGKSAIKLNGGSQLVSGPVPSGPVVSGPVPKFIVFSPFRIVFVWSFVSSFIT